MWLGRRDGSLTLADTCGFLGRFELSSVSLGMWDVAVLPLQREVAVCGGLSGVVCG